MDSGGADRSQAEQPRSAVKIADALHLLRCYQCPCHTRVLPTCGYCWSRGRTGIKRGAGLSAALVGWAGLNSPQRWPISVVPTPKKLSATQPPESCFVRSVGGHRSRVIAFPQPNAPAQAGGVNASGPPIIFAVPDFMIPSKSIPYFQTVLEDQSLSHALRVLRPFRIHLQ
jgi:hypothetical protein